jgi:hypothetical protein
MNSYLRMASLAAALLWVVPQNSNAAILTYDYQGQPLVGGGGAFTGQFVFDEALLPGGSLSGLTFSFAWNQGAFNGSPDFVFSKSLNIGGLGGGASYIEALTVPDLMAGKRLTYDWIAQGILVMRYGPLISAQNYGPNTRFSISFDADKHVIAWSGIASNGGMADPYTNNGIDGYTGFGLNSQSLSPGTWTGGPSSVAAVPLPAALPLFATGLGVMGLLGWRRKRKA